MAPPLRRKTVAVGVLYDDDLGFLLFFNKRWRRYAFAMKKSRADEDLGEIALVALDEDSPLKFPDASAGLAVTVGAFGRSGGVGEETYYDYHVFELDPGECREGPTADPTARFFRYQELMQSPDVTWSTKEIARGLVEFQEVCLAVITRRLENALQFLLIYNPSYGYFFPAARRKTNNPPEVMAAKAVEWDTSYDRQLDVQRCGEESDVHLSHRYGPRNREYRFHVCGVSVPDVDLTQPGNRLESALKSVEQARRDAGRRLGSRGYWDWFTEDEMQSGREISPTVGAILQIVLRCAEDENPSSRGQDHGQRNPG